MFGCLGRLGCLVVGGVTLLLVAGGAYYTRNRWLPMVRPGGGDVVADSAWAPLSTDGVARVRSAIRGFSRVDGPVFANVSAADLASFVLDSAVSGAVLGERGAEAAVRRDRILLRTRIRVGDLGADNLPLLGGMADKTATVIIGGTLSVEQPGAGTWRVTAIDVDAISVPGWAVSRVAREVARYLRIEQGEPAAFRFGLPPQVADVRVSQAGVTLYKAVQ